MGGLWALGFDEEERIYCITSAGLGVIDPISGQKLARDYDDNHYDDASEKVAAIGPTTAPWIEVAGDRGGIVTAYRLPVSSSDAWHVRCKRRPWTAKSRVDLVAPDGRATHIANVETLYAFGFSPSGRILVLGESHTVWIFRREVAD